MIRKIFILTLTLSVFILAQCSKKSDDNGTNPDTAGGSVTAKIDGKSWSASEVVATRNGNILTVTGQAFPGGTGSEQLQIIITNITAAGDFTLSFIGNTGRFSMGDASNITTYLTLDQNAGTAKVTKIDDKGAKGTFSFNAKNANNQAEVKKVTEGSFDVVFSSN